MDDLIAFLRARLDEDEQVAREAIDDASLTPREPGMRIFDNGAWFSDGSIRLSNLRLLAEVQAKRAILDLHTCPCPNDCGDCGQCSGAHMTDPTRFPCPTVKLLALPYQDHPDYRQERHT